MTDLSPDEIKQLTPVDLSDVSPTNITPTSLLQGTITIKWPYSSPTQTLTFLLANPDPRRRASGGQLKITLLGPAAEFLDKIPSGEHISIAPNPRSFSINIVKEESSLRVNWHVTFPKGCILIVTSSAHARMTESRDKMVHLDYSRRLNLPPRDQDASPLPRFPSIPHHPLQKSYGKPL
jgi:hypothetical protein